MTLQILFEQCSRAPGWLFDIGLYSQLYEDLMGIIVRQYKDPYKPISMMECHRGFERSSFNLQISSSFVAWDI